MFHLPIFYCSCSTSTPFVRVPTPQLHFHVVTPTIPRPLRVAYRLAVALALDPQGVRTISISTRTASGLPRTIEPAPRFSQRMSTQMTAYRASSEYQRLLAGLRDLLAKHRSRGAIHAVCKTDAAGCIGQRVATRGAGIRINEIVPSQLPARRDITYILVKPKPIATLYRAS